MKRAAKVFLIIALCLILAGAALFAGVMAKNNWDFASLGKDDYETHTYHVTENFQSISVRVDTENISFLPSEDGSCRVEITEKKEEPHTVAVEENTLCIKQSKNEKSPFSISFFSFEVPRIKVWLPKTEYEALFLETHTGYVEIPGDFTFGKISVFTTTGAVSCEASALGKLHINTTTGKIQVRNLSAETLWLFVTTGRIEASSVSCEGELGLNVSTGKAELTDVSCGSLVSKGSTGDLTMKNLIASGSVTIERSTGDIRFEACDAAELEISTDTGDVKGTLLTEKVFITRSDTGRIRVPETAAGGKCKITTDTGDIVIEIPD